MALLWFKDPHFDQLSQTFNGTIVYSNRKERPQSPGYFNRVEYITDVTSTSKVNSWIQCKLRITDLQKTDSGNYSFRFIGSKENKYMSKEMRLNVTGEQWFTESDQFVVSLKVVFLHKKGYHLLILMSIRIPWNIKQTFISKFMLLFFFKLNVTKGSKNYKQ